MRLVIFILLVPFALIGQNKIVIKVPYLPVYMGGGAGADSTTLTAGWGVLINESPANNWNVKADTSKLATLYDVLQVDQSATNELQTFSHTSTTNSHTLTLSNSGGSLILQEGTNVNLATVGNTVTINSTGGTGSTESVSEGYGINVVQAGSDYNVSADTTQLVTQYDLTQITTGTLDGTGTATRPAIWTDANTLSSDSELDWDNANKILKLGSASIGVTAPKRLQVTGTAGISEFVSLIENKGNTSSSGALNLVGANTNTAFFPFVGQSGTTSSVISRLVANNVSNTGGARLEVLSYGTTGNSFFVNGTSSINWSFGMKRNESYADRFIIADNASLSASNERLSIARTTGTVRIKSLDTDATAPTTSGTTKMVVSDGNGDLSFANIPTGGGIDSTVLIPAFGINIIESPANTYTVRADTNNIATQYDLTLLDQSATNELQTLSNSSTTNTHKLSLSNSGGQMVVKEGGNISLTTNSDTLTITAINSAVGVVTEGYGINVTTVGTDYNVAADTAQLATSYDLTLKQDKLVSGTNIKTINGNTLLGSGNLNLGTVTSIATSYPLFGGTITNSGTLGLAYNTISLGLNGSLELYAKYNDAIWNANALKGTFLSTPFTPTAGQYLAYDGTSWSPTTPSFTNTNLSFTGTSSPITLNSSNGSDVTITAGTGISLSGTSSNLTINATASGVTGLGTTNYMTYWNGTTSLASTSIAYGTSFVGLGFGVAPASVTHAIHLNGDAIRLQNNATIIDKNNSGGASGHVLSGTGGAGVQWASLSSLGADMSTTNELQSLSTTGAAGNISISSGNTVTLNVNDADANSSNELQNFSFQPKVGSSVTVADDKGTATYKFTEGSNITLNRTASNELTISASSGATDLSYTGTTSPITLNSSTGTDVTLTAGSGISLSGTSSNMTITANDNSATNEAQTLSSNLGVIALSNVSGVGGGSVTINSGTDINITTGTNSITVNSSVQRGFSQLSNSATYSNNSISGIVKIPFNIADALGSMSADATNERLTNSATGTRRIKISYSGTYEINATGTLKFYIYKNGVNIGYPNTCFVGYTGDNFNYPLQFSNSTIVSAAPNDYYELYFEVFSGGITYVDFNNLVFSAEIVY